MIPDFLHLPADIWITFGNFLEKEFGENLYEDDGGEVIENALLDVNTGYSRCVYEAWGINFSEDEETKDYQAEVFGYIIPFDKTNKKEGYYFLATEVNIKEK